MKRIALPSVIPAKAGIQTLGKPHWIPAFAGMTVEKPRGFFRDSRGEEKYLCTVMTFAISEDRNRLHSL